MAETADPRADYDVFDDPYCYKGTSVLKNIPGLRDPAALAAFETISVAQRADEPLPQGRFSSSHYRAIHRHLFQDVFRWAGRIRRVRVSKADNMFCYPEHCKFRSFRQAISVQTGRRFRWKPTGHFGPKRHPRCGGVSVPALANRRCVIHPILL